ncbi:universal stress protein [Actinacidiphila oryziradicis]|uniref:universal stress protein n=1 Tax=Actinacidiphila oryziradicis TaxID=2571141 RepID=UPI0023F32D16|nr:universal stress protein [Actinacidiphila oryziradicis]MCW2873152.1 UspA domain protein [Actinacidiphila oryziradicis]
MTRPVTVGLDGTPESLAAADWAAREAYLRGAPLRLVNAWPGEPQPELPPEQEAAWHHWAERSLRTARNRLGKAYPGLRIATEQIPGFPICVLLAEAEGAQLLVLGSREVGSVAGFFLGSVGLELAATARTPVVLVRGRTGSGAHSDVVVGLGLRRPCESVLEFAFDAAARRGAVLRAVHAGRIPAVWGYAPWLVDAGLRDAREGDGRMLSATLEPWRAKYPEVRVCEEIASGSPSRRLVSAGSGAALLIVGRGPHRGGGLGQRIGPVGQAVTHHGACPVAIVPYE